MLAEDEAGHTTTEQMPAEADTVTSLIGRFPYQEPTGKLCRVFLSHSGKCKQLVKLVKVELLKSYPALKDSVFLDEDSLKGGDKNMEVIYTSMRDAFVGKKGYDGL